MSRAVLYPLIAVIALFAVAETPVAGEEPSGVGEAKLRMSVDDLRSHYPEMEELGDQNLGALPIGGPHISRYVARDQQQPGLAKPSDLEFRFWKDKLWIIIVYFGENGADAVMATLREQLGSPTGDDKQHPRWDGEKTEVTVSPAQGWYGIADKAASKEAREWLITALTGSLQGKRESPTVQGTPLYIPPTPVPAQVTPIAAPVD